MKKNKIVNLFILFSCSVILLIVYYLEYFLDLKPCILCIYQRIPYFIIIFLAIILFFIKNNKLEIAKTSGKLNFIISSYAENCGYKSLKNNFECNIYKPLISKNLLN